MPSEGPRILIFEDNPSIQILLRIFLQKRGFTVKIAGDGTDAVALARDFKPELILMDIIMPGKDGIEACTDLRRESIQTPIIMLTSKSFEDDQKRGLAAGANAYLRKPFDPQKLEEVIAPLLNH